MPGVYSHAFHDTVIRGAKPADKPQKLFDGNGLFLFVVPSGTKSRRWKYRFQGREKLLNVLRKIEAREANCQAKRIRESCSLVFRYAIATSDLHEMLRIGEAAKLPPFG